MVYMTAKEAVAKWNISERRVQMFCEQMRIKEVARFGKSWAEPGNAKKPLDARTNNI